MLRALLVLLAATGLVVGSASLTRAQDDSDESSAMDQLEDAAEDGQDAVEAESEEDAKEESNETFDTPHDSDGD